MARDPAYDADGVTEVVRRRGGPPRPGGPPPWWREHWWIWGLLLLLFVGLLIAFFVLRGANDDDGDRTAEANVPNLVGMREPEAVRRLEALDVRVEVDREASDEPEGTVIDQDPDAGASADVEQVIVVVSEGPATETVTQTETVTRTETVAPEPVAIPDVVGEAHVDAGATVDEVGLVGDTYPVPSEEPAGTVISQNPDAGTRVPEGTVIRLNVALGPDPRTPATVPTLTDMDAAEARDRCRRAGFTCRTVAQAGDDDGGEADEVRAQRPLAGVRTARLTQITLVVD